MILPFKILRGEMLFQVVFSRPAFSLLNDFPGLYAKLFDSFSRYGLQLRDMKVEQGTGSLGEVMVSFFLMNLDVAVRLQFDRVEIQSFNIIRVTQEQVHEMAAVLLKLLQSDTSEIAFQTYSLRVDCHGVLEDKTPAKDFLARFTASAPQGHGTLLASGVVFYYGAERDRVNSSLTIDLSAMFPNALFLRVSSVWDATRLSIDEFAKSTREYFHQSLTSVGLRIN